MPVSATLASQELLRPSPKSPSPADEGVVAASQGILTAAFSAGPVHSSLATPSGHRRRGTLTSSGCLYVRVSGGLLTAWSPMSIKLARLWVLASLIYPVVTSPLLLSTLSP
jgi:hypothetical protein